MSNTASPVLFECKECGQREIHILESPRPRVCYACYEEQQDDVSYLPRHRETGKKTEKKQKSRL